MLGRPRVGERLLPVEIAALDKRSEPPPNWPVKPAFKAERVNVQGLGDHLEGAGDLPEMRIQGIGGWGPRPGATAGQVRRVQGDET